MSLQTGDHTKPKLRVLRNVTRDLKERKKQNESKRSKDL